MGPTYKHIIQCIYVNVILRIVDLEVSNKAILINRIVGG